MPKETRAHKDESQGRGALESLLNDQAEARLQREISISRTGGSSKTETKSPGQGKGRKKSGTKASAGSVQTGPEYRQKPSMKETKAQLIKRMEMLLAEFDKLEAKIEQKDLELDKAKSDKTHLKAKLDKLQTEVKGLQDELQNKTGDQKKLADLERKYAEKVLKLEKDRENILRELSEKDSTIAGLQKEKSLLESEIDRMEVLVSEAQTKEELHQASLKKKDQELGLLQKEKHNLEQELEKLSHKTAARKKEEAAWEMQAKADDWRVRADELWDGSAYKAPQKAVYYLNAALELRPDWPQALNDRGLAHLDDFDLDGALEDFTTAIALKRDFAEAYHNRGVALLKSGKKFAARKDFQVAAGLGLWLGINALQVPKKDPGIIERLINLVFKRRDKK
ncbi:tetratricopeptide repeat protein [Desulfonatronovibrio hydrogenovorans]|uniref:tetratricopeptide repeat protein n=1 Tax=Desulfonatronovibrio hydrogenovorans TaxID=53245 RepID=UPI00048B6A05|nr:tetratricopeptide repeat protein [Desulfonatronovibrio hydrogenovorans]